MLKVLQSQSCCKLTETETAHQTAIETETPALALAMRRRCGVVSARRLRHFA